MRLFVIKLQTFLAGLLLISLSSNAAEVVVIDSNVSKYPAKKIIDVPSAVSLRSGEWVKLVAESGELYTLKGPYQGNLSGRHGRPAKKSDIPNDIWLIIKPKNGRTKSLKPTRGTDSPEQEQLKTDEPESFWWVDIELTEPQCVRSDTAIKLWRKHAELAFTMTLQQQETDEAIKLSWPVGTHTLDWPAKLDFEKSENYMVKRDGLDYMLKIFSVPEKTSEQLVEG
ncbi:MAG: hypothetical protein AAF512_02205, partial [Pseudomonadota bacterium]